MDVDQEHKYGSDDNNGRFDKSGIENAYSALRTFSLRVTISCLVIRVPRMTSQCMKNGWEKFDLMPITWKQCRTELAVRSTG